MSSPLTLRHCVDGERLAAAPGFDSINPSDTSDVVAHVPNGDSAVIDAAVEFHVQLKTAYPWA